MEIEHGRHRVYVGRSGLWLSRDDRARKFRGASDRATAVGEARPSVLWVVRKSNFPLRVVDPETTEIAVVPIYLLIVLVFLLVVYLFYAVINPEKF